MRVKLGTSSFLLSISWSQGMQLLILYSEGYNVLYLST